MNEPHSAKIRLLLIDDHALFREGLARLLGSEADFEIAAPCANVTEAMRVLQTTKIDLILLDYDLGQETGARFLVRASEIGFQGRVLIVTAGLAESEAADLLRHGAAGSFLKHNSPDLLAKAIRKVMQGEVWLDQKYLSAGMMTKSATVPSTMVQAAKTAIAYERSRGCFPLHRPDRLFPCSLINKDN